MKYQITRFKSLEAALKELEPFIRNGEHLETGKPFKRFGGLRSRELLANWLLCAVVNYDSRAADRLTFTSDPLGGDGIIYDSEKDASWPTEPACPMSSSQRERARRRMREAPRARRASAESVSASMRPNV